MGVVQHRANALQYTACRFGDFKPDGRQHLDHGDTIDLIHEPFPDHGKDVIFKAGNPVSVPLVLPAFFQSFVAIARCRLEVGHNLPRSAPLGDRIDALTHLAP